MGLRQVQPGGYTSGRLRSGDYGIEHCEESVDGLLGRPPNGLATPPAVHWWITAKGQMRGNRWSSDAFPCSRSQSIVAGHSHRYAGSRSRARSWPLTSRVDRVAW
jgi:hypothetical protein